MGRHITDRTAVYGPVCTVVWEGAGREARPYPVPRVRPPQAGATLGDVTQHAINPEWVAQVRVPRARHRCPV